MYMYIYLVCIYIQVHDSLQFDASIQLGAKGDHRSCDNSIQVHMSDLWRLSRGTTARTGTHERCLLAFGFKLNCIVELN